ncbi:MAG: hypothetical protein SGPRY_011180 [Prymnesium sp.]
MASLVCCTATPTATRISGVHAICSWFFMSHIEDDPSHEAGELTTAISSLLGVCDAGESYVLCEEAARAVSSLARLPSLRPIIVRLGGALALLRLLLNLQLSHGITRGSLLVSLLNGLCILCCEPVCKLALAISPPPPPLALVCIPSLSLQIIPNTCPSSQLRAPFDPRLLHLSSSPHPSPLHRAFAKLFTPLVPSTS